MFEAILERLLKKILGEYFEGFDSSNIGVGLWSGEVVIQNVRLKASAIAKLGFPFLLKYSFIRSLRLKIPWKSLTSSKIEIYFNGLYIVMGEQPEKDWVIRDVNLISRRKREVDTFAEEVMKKYDERRNTKPEEEDGFKDRLLLRIIDNLQVSISDIHIRYEDDQAGYDFGLTLEHFKLTTVNKNGQDEFIDRSKPEYKNEPLRKRLELRNFGVYWSSKSKPLQAPNDLAFQQSMSALVQKTTDQRKPDYLILISSEAKLLQRNKGNFEVAETTLEVSIKQLAVYLENRQVQQMITLSETLQRYRDLVRESNRIILDEPVRKKNLEDFMYLYRKYLTHDNTLEGDELARYEHILERMETQEFARIIREEVKLREKKKIISNKETKKFAWISYGKKDLSEAELKEIEKFLEDNFSEEEIVVTRPRDYSYLEVKLFLEEAVFTIGRVEGSRAQGVELSLKQLSTSFRKRENGYFLNFVLADLAVDLFRHTETENEREQFFYKMGVESQKYIEIGVNGHPIDKPHVDVELQIKVERSVIVFTPVFITRLQRFIDLRINQSNKDKAREKLGQIKDKTSQTLVSTLEDNKIKVIALDVEIRAPVIVLPFEPGSEGACWCIDTGLLQIRTDDMMLNPHSRPDFEKYILVLRQLSLSWYKTKKELLESKKNREILPKEMLVKDFEVELAVSLLRNNKNKERGNVLLQGRLPLLDMSLSSFSYQQLLLIGDCFKDNISVELTSQPSIAAESKKEEQVAPKTPPPKSQKKEILEGNEKLGMMYMRSPTTKLWDRYICILKGNFIYFFADKNAESYSEEVFVRNSTLEDLDESCGRSNAFMLSNRVNKEVMLSTDKKELTEQWKSLILAKKDEQDKMEAVLEQLAPPKPEVELKRRISGTDYEQLKVEVLFEIPRVQLSVYERIEEKSWLRVSINGLALKLDLYEAKKSIQLLLKELSLVDSMQLYVNPQLHFLLESRLEQGMQQLVAITILQIDSRDPTYSNIDNSIEIRFGLLLANFKPRVINKLFEFFLPASKPQQEFEEVKKQEKAVQNPKQSFGLSSIGESILSAALTDIPEVERIGVRLRLYIGGINLNMVNRNNHLKHGWLEIRWLEFQLKKSEQMMELNGSLKRLRIADSTNYPNTFLSEAEYIDGCDLLLVDTSSGQDTELVDFNIKLLEHVQPGQKKIILRVIVKDLFVDYFQQPALRIIHYLLEQALPALKQDQGLKLRKPEVQAPQPTDFYLNVSVVSSKVMLRSNPADHEKQLVLNVGCIEVQNCDTSEKYCGDSTQVLTANYRISINGLEVAVNERSLTNDFNFMLNVALVQSPEYYKLAFHDTFQPGIRIGCRLSPFLMRLDNPDFKLIMKCLNCNIAFDDNCDRALFPEKFVEEQRVSHLAADEKEPSDPLYFQLHIDILTLAVSEQLIPVSNLTLSELEVTFTSLADRMRVTVTVTDIIGSSFRLQGNMYEQRGIIKQLDVRRLHNPKDLVELKDLVRLFYVSQASSAVKASKRHDLIVLFEKSKTGDTLTEITLESLSVSLQLRPLLKLSKLASLDDSVKAPPPKMPSAVTPQTSENRIRLTANSLILRAAASSSSQQLGISGQFFFDYISKPSLNRQQVQEECKKLGIERLLENGRMSVTVNYLDIFLLEASEGRLKKRVLLNPTNIIVVGTKNYSVIENKLLLSDEYIIKLEFVLLEATIKDLITLKGLYMQAMEILAEGQSPKLPELKLQEQTSSKSEGSGGSDGDHLLVLDNGEFKEQIIALIDESTTLTELRAEVNIREIRVAVLYESDSIFIPVVQLELLETNPIFKSNIMLQQLSLVTFTQLSFFNPRSSKWEPILEKNSFTVEYVNTKKEGGSEITIGVQCGNDPLLQKLNINVSSQFLTSLAEVLSEMKKQDNEMMLKHQEPQISTHAETEKLEVSPYVVENLTFDEIAIIIEAPAEQSVSNYHTAAARQRITAFDRTRNHQKDIVLGTRTLAAGTRRSIDIPEGVREIKIKLDGTVHSVLIDGFAKRRIGQTNYIVDCRVERLNRLIRVLSETITNRTTKDISVRIGKHELLLKPGQEGPLTGEKVFYLAVPDKAEMISQPIVKEDMYVVTPVNCKQKYHYNIVKEEEEIGGMFLQSYAIYSPLKMINCLPKPLQLQIIFHNKTTAHKQLKSQQEYEIHSHAKGEEIRMKVSLPNCFWSYEVSIEQSVERQVEMTLKDSLSNQLVIKALVTKDQDTHTIEIAFFCQAYLINESPYDFIVYGITKVKGEHSKRIAGQIDQHSQESERERRLIIIGYETDNYIKLASKALPTEKSEKIFVGGLNSNQIQLVLVKNGTDKKLDRVVQLEVSVSIKQMHKNSSLLCKEVRIVPRQIVVNLTGQMLTLRQEGEIVDHLFEPNERQILEYRKSKERKVTFRLPDTHPSSLISVENLGVVNFFVQEKERNSKVFMKMDTQLIDGYVIIAVSLQKPEEVPYLIRNRTKEFVIEVPVINEKVEPGGMTVFSWKDPSASRTIEIRLHHRGEDSVKYVEINPDKVGSKKKVQIQQLCKTTLYVTVKVLIIGDRRAIEVRSKTTEDEERKNEVLSTIGVKISQISLSLVLNHGSIARPYEAFNITLYDLEYVSQTGTLEQIYQVRLRFLQIDQNYPHLLVMPVVVTPSKYKEYTNKERTRNIINLLIKRNVETTRTILLEEVTLEINPLTIRVSELFIKLILELFREFTLALNVKDEDYLVKRNDDERWKTLKIESTAVPIYIEEIRISPIDLDISAQLKPPDNGQRQFIMVEMVLKGLGVVVANIDEAPIRLRGIELKGCFDSPSGISQKLMMLYKQSVIMEIYKLFGSFNAIGNPASLFNNIATGLTDLVEKPAEGFVKGPLELGLGIVEGAHSLVAHTVGGAFNSVSKITGTISSGLSLLAFDKNFEALREKQKMKKPKNIIQGLEKGAKAIYSGFKEGMTGIFLRPYEEAKKDGVAGFFKGTAQGLAGIIIKPVTGILDFAADTTEGIKNTALYFEDKPNENRMRCPRVFYGRNSQLREFVTIDAQINNLLQVMKKGRFANSYFLQSFMLQGTGQLLAILDDFVVVLSFRKKKVEWWLPIRTIKSIRCEPDGLKMNLGERSKYFDNDIAVIQSNVPEQQEMIQQLIEEQMRYQRR